MKMVLWFYLTFLVMPAFAGPCETAFATNFEKNLAELLEIFNRPLDNARLCESDFPEPLTPHAHKRGPGQKYYGATAESFQKESQRKKKEFNDFFLSHFPAITGDETKMSFWANQPIQKSKDFDHALAHAQALEEKGYPLKGFIFIIDRKGALLMAPRTMEDGEDVGLAKHIALAQGEDLRAAGEFSISKNNVLFNLKSGTYLKGQKKPIQFLICLKVEELFKKLNRTRSVNFSEQF
jgi:hypothetical protein